MENTQPLDTDALYRELFTPLFRYVFVRTKDKEIANDLTQSVFLKYLLQEKKPTGKDHALKLLFTIARTGLIDHWRMSGRRVHESLDMVAEPAGDMLNPEEEAIASEDRASVHDAMQMLSDIENDIVAMRISGDMDYETIAEVTQVSVVNARKIYSRALQKVGAIITSKDLRIS